MRTNGAKSDRRIRVGVVVLALAGAAIAPVSRGVSATAPAVTTPWTCPAGPFGNPIPAGATVARVATALPSDAFNNFGTLSANVEGPVWRNGALFVSEFGAAANPVPTRVLRIAGTTTGTVYQANAGTNGLAVNSAGVLFGASHKVGAVVRFGASGTEPTVVVGTFGGVRLNSPNDLTIRSDGTIYFTDPTWQAPVPAPQLKTRVYRIPPGTHRAVSIDANRNQPNGVTLSPDEQTLYVSSLDGLYKYAVAADGTVGPPARFAPAVAKGDGMVADCAGNLYVTNTDVIVLNPSGAEIGRLHMPAGAGTVTNVAFGGPNRTVLFITAMGKGTARGVYKVALSVPGFPY